MTKTNVDITKTLRALAELSHSAQEVSNLAQGGAELIANEARRLAPVDTGALRNSIEVQDTSNGAAVVVGADYGMAVEFGLGHSPSQPFLRPAIESQRAKIVSEMSQRISISVRR